MWQDVIYIYYIPATGICVSWVETIKALSLGASCTFRHIRLSSLPCIFRTTVNNRTGWESATPVLNLSTHIQDENVSPDWGGNRRSPKQIKQEFKNTSHFQRYPAVINYSSLKEYLICPLNQFFNTIFNTLSISGD